MRKKLKMNLKNKLKTLKPRLEELRICKSSANKEKEISKKILEIGILYYNVRKLDESLKYYNEFFETNYYPNESLLERAFNKVGSVYYSEGQYEEAMR